MTDILQEYCDSRGVAMRVDRPAGVIRGVKVLGLESRNGRSYLPDALAQAARLYEGAKVNVNHPRGNPAAPRDYQDRLGSIRGVAMRPGEGLFADLYFNPKHALAEQLIWDAEHAPENVGFSHNVEALVSRRDGRLVVEAITRVQSVDLVADPATTRGLFESQAATDAEKTDGAKSAQSPAADNLQEQADELARLRQEVERFRALEERRQRREQVAALLGEFGLPDPHAADPLAKTVSSERFVESLLVVDAATARAMVEDRARLVRALNGAKSRPLSVEQHLLAPAAPRDAKSFVEAIT
jgi:hypothetical protein